MSSRDHDGDATLLMLAAADGDQAAADALLPLVLEQLRRAAQRQLANEPPGTRCRRRRLVHEAYLRLAGPRDVPWSGARPLLRGGDEAMRRILIDHARARSAHRRGGPDARRAAVNLASLPDPSSPDESSGFLILDEAITRLESVDREAATVVRFRYFAGLSVEETAAAMGISTATVKRTWAFARGWLSEAIESGRV